MLSLKAPKRKRIQLPSNTPQLLYTQNDVFAEAFCTDAYTLSAQCTCFRSKLLSRRVYSSPPIRPSICIRKMMLLLRGSYAEAYTLSAQCTCFRSKLLSRSVYSSPPIRLSICIRKMMLLLQAFAQKRIHRPSNTPQLLYTQNDVFAEAFCTDAYTLSAQCTCFRSKLLSRRVYSSPPIRPSICICKMMFLLKLSAQMRIQLPSQTPQLLYTQNDVFAEAFCTDAYTLPLADAPASVYAK